jgi:hypothetical protein
MIAALYNNKIVGLAGVHYIFGLTKNAAKPIFFPILGVDIMLRISFCKSINPIKVE